jgi:hypothetical protein
MGRLIPAGTGLGAYKRLTVDVAIDAEDDDGDMDSYIGAHDHAGARDVDAVEAAD